LAMHSFVVVASKPEGRITPDALAFLRHPDVAELGFVPDDHIFWTDAPQRVAFAGWQARSPIGQIGSYWHTDELGLTAFTGRMWPKGGMWKRGPDWAEQLATYWRACSLVGSGQPLGGVYAAVSITKGGTGAIVTDPLSVSIVYTAETDDFVAYSTSAHVAARTLTAAGQEPERDALAAAWLPFLGWIVGDRTGFTSTRVLPMGSYVEIGPAFGSRVRFSDSTPWASDLPPDEPGLVSLVHDDLSASVRSIAQVPAPARAVDITGGRDSRLVLALMLQEGVADGFDFRTSGYQGSPDVVIGKRIAAQFGLDHDVAEPRPIVEENFRSRLASHVFQTAGMFGAWELKGGTTISSTLRATGCLGEALRTHFHDYPDMATIGDLRTQFYGRSALRACTIVRPDVRSKLFDLLDQELVQRMDGGGSSPQDLADSFYWRQRNRRWFGTYEEFGEAGRVHPLYSLVGLQAAFALGGQKRRHELLHFAIMRRACPDLAKMPLADAAWSETLLSGLADADDYRIPAVRSDRAGPAPTQWRPQRLLDNIGVARDLLLGEASSSLHDIIDHKAVRRLLADPEQATPYACRQLFGALAAAVWLGRHESWVRIGTTPGSVDRQRSQPLAAQRRWHAKRGENLRSRIRAIRGS
jgi:hypothetical protein